ncbi:uncharacterized protein LOC126589165 [Malus sylvestris]|uniref:uncharacterized protein LOC126589165 n=1 Tax=Malus sylvestris TaxID=3752 RepID=UPI0021AD1B57|nr:uncharacterized protein LOC126589165 [Malus sylvestris]
MVRDAYDDWYGSTLYELQSGLVQIEKKKGKALYTMNNMSFTKAKRRSSIFHIPNTDDTYQYRRIRKEEVVVALKKMKHRKAIGPDDIPIEVWKVLGETGME